ncbi:MAG TPA: FHA domain-containing protein [Gemmataceae bacterium]|nr:FHA domain-containing protein [Gemmataceae bacterium]
MNDPRLNSVHLDFPRREDFRRARGLLLDARGEHTLAEEPEGHESGEAHTMIEGVRDSLPASAEFWLMDRESAYPLKIGVNTIGRLPDNDVVIPGAYVSRRHCAILVHAGDGCELYDIASKNGTYINGARLSGPTQLQAGDEIRMCDREFVFMSNKGKQDQPSFENTQTDD